MNNKNSHLKTGISGLVILMLLSASFFAVAQRPSKASKDFKYSVSQPYPVIDAAEKDYFHKGESVIAIKQSGGKVTIQRFGKARLNQISVREYSDMPDGYDYEGFVETGGKLLLLFNVWDRPNKKEQLFCREISYETGEFVGKDKLLLSVNGKVQSLYGRAKFRFHNCLDSTKFMVQYKNINEAKDDSKNFEKAGLFVFDSNLNKIWGSEMKMPYTEKKMDITDYALDSRGNIYILSKVFNTNTTKEKGRGGVVNYHMELFYLTQSSPEPKITQFVLGSKFFISSMLIYESTSDYMICVGYSNDGENLSSVSGIFACKVKNGTEIFDKSVIDIPIEVITQYMSAKDKAKLEKKDAKENDDESVGLNSLVMKKLIVDGDGGFIVIGEQAYSITTSNGKSSYTTYYYNDMLMTKIDPSGKVAWMQKLPKRQSGARPKGGLSFKYMNQGEYSYLLYMDNVKNIELPINQAPVYHRDGAGGYLTSYKVNESTGEIYKVAIFDTKDVKGTEVFQFDTDRIFSIDNSEFLVEMYKKGNEDVMIRVEIGEEVKN